MLVRGFVGLAQDQRGVTAVEYALIASLIAMAIVASVSLLGNATSERWGNISNEVAKASK